MNIVKKVNLKKIERILFLSLKNAVRLHSDSILLFRYKKYPSAYFLSIIALEEIGKYFLLDDFLWHSRVDGRMELRWEKKFIDLIFMHRCKQNKFVRNLEFYGEADYNADFEKRKQNALYVGLPKRNIGGKIINPIMLKAGSAKRQITYLNDRLILFLLRSNYEQNYEDYVRVLNLKLFRSLLSTWPYMTEKYRTKSQEIVNLLRPEWKRDANISWE
ncbi:MAG: AbiV family abortive infection protein [Elusimicrobia bacterium]|nr:AbiV family abortive infection protein [Candidatus Omnitrophota bacterium]MCG2725723.1 AbiV family abortive infection protein [Elusimicrobiota bacterium]